MLESIRALSCSTDRLQKSPETRSKPHISVIFLLLHQSMSSDSWFYYGITVFVSIPTIYMFYKFMPLTNNFYYSYYNSLGICIHSL